MKPIIGITCGEIINSVETWSSTVYGQSWTYPASIVRAGGVPVLLPLIEDRAVLRQLYEQCDGLLFAGGNDIDPTRYGQQPYPETKPISTKRDTQEWQLLGWALADNKPLFGICRGMQLLNVYLRGSLYQHLPANVPAAQNHTASQAHKDTTFIAHALRLTHDSRLAAIVGPELLPANSQHHQAVHTLGDGLVASAHAEDGIVEAIELPGAAFALAVQPHPEGLDASVEPRWQKLFAAFVQAARAGRDETLK